MRVLRLNVNGDTHEVAAPEHWTLLEVLRYEMGLTGSKQGCDKGDCGACTVLVDGAAVKSCTMLAVQADGRDVVTIEGVGSDGLHPLQETFVESRALQCGFCTPGMIMSALELLGCRADPTPAEIRDAIDGNLCRCTGYHSIVEAIQRAAARIQGGAAGASPYDDAVDLDGHREASSGGR